MIILAMVALGLADIQFTKHVLETRFVADGVAVGDVNRDGKADIVAGNLWFEAPKWTPHEIVPAPSLDPKTQYSNCFNTWMADLNGDGWTDQILIGIPGERAVWRENPKGAGEWKEHVISDTAGNESPLYVDLFKNGKKVLIMAHDDKFLAWFEPAPNPNDKWIAHDISASEGPGSNRYSHGLGIGDLNGDGTNEVLVKGGYYSDSKGSQSHWVFVAADFGPDCAQMSTLDVRGSGLMDVLTTSAHARGVWWHEAVGDGTYLTHEIDKTISVTHAANLVTIDGKPNLITGKRKWGHPPGVDVGSEEPHWLVRYEFDAGKWTRHIIDEDSGVGTQFVVQDVTGDGRVDIVTSNKNGVFLFEQTQP